MLVVASWRTVKANSGPCAIQLYRPHRGNFDAWRRYIITVDGDTKTWIADGQLRYLHGPEHIISVSVGIYRDLYTSGDVRVTCDTGGVYICELAANPNTERPAVRILRVSEEEAQQRVLRFDRPPYIGGRAIGLLQALVAIGAAGAFAVAWLVFTSAGIGVAVRDHSFPVAVIAIAGALFGCSVFGFASACGLRSIYYYFCLPRSWRH